MNKKFSTAVFIAAAMFSSATWADFKLESPDVAPGEILKTAQVYSGFGCTGGNVSPQLTWSGQPKGTKSFAITAYDPDAPTGSGWWHWLVYNIPATVNELAAGSGAVKNNEAVPGFSQGKTDYGSYGYGGACPPKGSKPHRYQFKVFALDVEQLDLPEDASAALIGFNLNAHKLESAGIEALYQR